ncbi:hypothetical protein Q5P01_023587 [Channa striata]|uniref:Uncharacterized protein n=1 Tax=Channa striata TaxID=64152 RepID=A0AA88JAD2_CHASR|nr:hypothetical protein Q5P01_023587 [Channa striata]
MRETRPWRIAVPSALMQALSICVETVSHAKGGMYSWARSTGSTFSSGQRSVDKKATLTQEHRRPHESKRRAAKG